MDKEVDRLCAKDGGIKIFEQISLPADKFDQFGNPDIPLSSWKNSTSSKFFIEVDVEKLIQGSATGRDSPALFRVSNRAIRAQDRRILGEATSYYRFGGDPDGPWHLSNYFGCPHAAAKALSRQVFLKDG